jgi:hypothetical protein
MKRPGREADHSSPSSNEVKECVCGAMPQLPNTPSLRGAQLKEKHGDNFTFTLLLILCYASLKFLAQDFVLQYFQ